MAEQATSTRSDPAARGGSETPELREELARSKEEVLRLRDLLIGKDAEMGALRGRVAELEAGTARLLNLSARLRSRIPSFVWSARASLRKRRG
ncbi:MAG TPA: hypothetical protein VN756_06195 [Solirubrobacterales bacterium]|nr:hypothetical protein [Solirubrobacterales bacterium]